MGTIPKRPGGPTYETPKALAERHALSVAKIHRMVKAGTLRSKRVGRHLLIETASATAALARRAADA